MDNIIVSFTSYPARIGSVKKVLDSLYAQTLRADEIILWLAQEEFPQKETELPPSLQEDLSAQRFTLRWCDNLGSHKKYFYAMQEYPEDIIVTVDDDTFYHPDSLQKLVDAHNRFPHAVAALTTTLVQLDSALKPLPIFDWLFDFQKLCEPSMLLMAIGVGGVLYPPHAVDKRIFDKQLIRELCTVKGIICGDDLLLKTGELLNGTPVVCVVNKPYYRLPDTQETALAKIMPNEEHKNLITKRIEERFRDCFDEQSMQRLNKEWSEFEQLDKRYALRKTHWISRASRDLERSIGHLFLPGDPAVPDASDHANIKSAVQLMSRAVCAYQFQDTKNETAEAIAALREQIIKIPGIDSIVCKSIEVRGLVEYGVLLNTQTCLIWRGIPVFMQNFKNWQMFLTEHPHCDSVYRQSFEKFLTDMDAKVSKSKNVLSETDIDAWKQAYQDIKPLQTIPDFLKKCIVPFTINTSQSGYPEKKKFHKANILKAINEAFAYFEKRYKEKP